MQQAGLFASAWSQHPFHFRVATRFGLAPLRPRVEALSPPRADSSAFASDLRVNNFTSLKALDYRFADWSHPFLLRNQRNSYGSPLTAVTRPGASACLFRCRAGSTY